MRSSYGLLIALGLTALSGCDLLDGVGGIAGVEPPQPPSAALMEVALVDRPPRRSLLAFFCHDFAGDNILGVGACTVAFGAQPERVSLRFSFETVFELKNRNAFPIPLVELLLALDVFEGDEAAQLGAICVSFCDPAAEDCSTEASGMGCQAPDKTVRDIEDFVPTVDDLIRIAANIASGEAFDDNLSFRFIPAQSRTACHAPEEGCTVGELDGEAAICCDGACSAMEAGCSPDTGADGRLCALCDGRVEAHVRFDLGIDPMIEILGQVLGRSADSLAEGRAPSLDIPYSAEGTLFFDVPVLGRFALAFGPFSRTWSLD